MNLLNACSKNALVRPKKRKDNGMAGPRFGKWMMSLQSRKLVDSRENTHFCFMRLNVTTVPPCTKKWMEYTLQVTRDGKREEIVTIPVQDSVSAVAKRLEKDTEDTTAKLKNTTSSPFLIVCFCGLPFFLWLIYFFVAAFSDYASDSEAC